MSSGSQPHLLRWYEGMPVGFLPPLAEVHRILTRTHLYCRQLRKNNSTTLPCSTMIMHWLSFTAISDNGPVEDDILFDFYIETAPGYTLYTFDSQSVCRYRLTAEILSPLACEHLTESTDPAFRSPILKYSPFER